MTKRIPNVCRWWQRHDWTQWTMIEAVSTNVFTGRESDCLVQSRKCTRCGYHQIERVRGR